MTQTFPPGFLRGVMQDYQPEPGAESVFASYLHWSLLDNCEWGRYGPTFGLVAVNRVTFRRTPKPSLAWLGGERP